MHTGVILAAGFGSRLADADADAIKPLTPVAGRPLVLRTLASLAMAGCHRVVLVLGHRAPEIRAMVEDCIASEGFEGLTVLFVYNPRHDLANGISVLAARPLVHGDFVLTMADHVFGDEVMVAARDHAPPPGGVTLLVDRKLDTIFDMDDATKVQTRAEHIVAIGKHLTHYDAVDTGLFVCTAGLFEALERVANARGDASLSEGMTELAARGLATTLDIGAGRWQDVDTPAMLAHAARVFG